LKTLKYFTQNKKRQLNKFILILISSLYIFSCNSSSKECSKYNGQELIEYFDVEQIDMNNAAYEKYIRDESKYFKKEIDLQVSQDKDITIISYVKLGGQADIQCVEIITDRQKLDIINYESNFAKEVTVRRIEYKIYNPNKYELGKIDFKFFK